MTKRDWDKLVRYQRGYLPPDHPKRDVSWTVSFTTEQAGAYQAAIDVFLSCEQNATDQEEIALFDFLQVQMEAASD